MTGSNYCSVINLMRWDREKKKTRTWSNSVYPCIVFMLSNAHTRKNICYSTRAVLMSRGQSRYC